MDSFGMAREPGATCPVIARDRDQSAVGSVFLIEAKASLAEAARELICSRSDRAVGRA
jgi:hypothetical protein